MSAVATSGDSSLSLCCTPSKYTLCPRADTRGRSSLQGGGEERGRGEERERRGRRMREQRDMKVDRCGVEEGRKVEVKDGVNYVQYVPIKDTYVQ